MFFLASMGISQAHEQAVMNYWWVRPEAAPAHAAGVVRVLGEKGERFEDVYTLDRQARLENSPVVMQARLQRQEMLRREAMALVKKLKAEGKSPVVAYEEAWTRVYKNRWLTANWQLGSSKLEDMLLRMSAENQSELTAEEQQWVLEALLENDDRLETKEGRELLRRLTQRLRALGYGKFYSPNAANDQVMKRFADALSTGMDSMAAYREAMFTTHRNRVGQHSLHGYVAPWGIRVGGPRYHQAPQKVGVTEGSASGLDAALAANPQPGNQLTVPGLNEVSAAEKDFLASSPEDEKKEKKNEQEDELVKQGESTASAPTAGMAAAPAPMMRGFSLRAAAPYAAGDDVAAIAENTITAGTNTSFHTTTTLDNQTLTLGNWYAATWKTNAQNTGKNGNVTATITFAAWDGGANGVKINGTPASFNLAGGNLYLGKGYSGTIAVSGTGSVLHAETLEHDSESKSEGFWIWQTTATAHAVYQVPGSGEFNYGTLSGSGELTLSNNAAANNAVIYSFDDSRSTPWFSGTMKFGASRGGIVELDLGKGGATTVWKNTVFDMARNGQKTEGYGITSNTEPSKVILNLCSDASIAGLKGGDANSTVTSQASEQDISPTLTLGDATDNTYTYDGTFNSFYYVSDTASRSDSAPLNLTKVGSNTQIITRDITADALDNNALDGSLNLLTVMDGTLQFNGNLETTKTHAYGGVLTVNENLTVTGGEDAGSEVVALQVKNGAQVQVKGQTAAYNANVLSGSTLSSGTLDVDHNLHVDGTGSSVTTNDLKAGHIYVSNAGKIQVDGNIVAETGIDIGYSSGSGKSVLISTGNLETGGLRLRSDAEMYTGTRTIVDGDVHLHGGALWEMSGESNSISGTMYLEDATSDKPVVFKGEGAVLTMPGVIDFANSSWSGTEALMALEGVTLDFSLGVQLRNIGFKLEPDEKNPPILTLASTTSTATVWEEKNGSSVTVWDSAGKSYHADLGYTLIDGTNYVTLKVLHEVAMPVTIDSGDVVYIEMYSNATSPALPHLAYTSAKYNNNSSTWSGTSVSPNELLKFTNLQVTEGAYLYMGEIDKGSPTGNYRADHHFGGNITISSSASAADAVVLNGQLGTWGNWYLDGHLSGRGDLKLVAHHTNSNTSIATNGTRTEGDSTIKTTVHGQASVFTFTSMEKPQSWMKGTLSMANPQGGTVQLNVGNVDSAGQGDIRWKDVVVDLSRSAYKDHTSASGKEGTAASLVLGLMGNATVAALKGDSNSSVVTNRKADSTLENYTLTLGEKSSASYTFGGTIGDGYFYTGGLAYTTTTTTKIRNENTEGEIVETTVTTVQENNVIDSRKGSLNLVKVGTNTQIFSGNAYLGTVEVQGGTLTFSGTADIDSLVVHSGAKFSGGNLTVDSATLYGGATWISTAASPNAYSTPLYLADVFGENGAVSSITLNASGKTWVSSMYLNMQEAGTWSADSGAIFTLAGNTKIDLSKPRVITNMDGITGGSLIKLYDNWTGSTSFGDNLIMVEDQHGNFYDADYKVINGTLCLQLESQAGHYGIVINDQEVHKDLNGYIWSGENNGTIIDNNVHYLNMTMGSVWRADGSAQNTGWHEQRAVGSTNDDIGVYANGNAVYFLDSNVHGAEEAHRKVDIKGAVAPGTIYVMADKNLGNNGSSEAVMEFGYAFVSTDGTGYIADYSKTVPTSIIKEGDAILLINTSNTFSGGIDVRDGGLYLAAVGAAGTGDLLFHTDKYWEYKVAGSDKKLSATMKRTGAELMICYPHSDEAVSGFRGSTLANDIVLTDTDISTSEAGSFKISFAHASFNEKGSDNDHANVPRHWRNLTLSGALVGTGYYQEDGNKNKVWVNTSKDDVIELTGYSSTWANNRDQSYVTSFTLNEDTIGNHAYIKDGDGKILNRFAGTVKLMNTVNTSPLPSNTLSNRIAGTVQVTLKGDKLVDSMLDMTRESEWWTGETAWNGKTSGNNKVNVAAPRQTYNNILLINGDATLRGLSAQFRGSGYIYGTGALNNTNSGSSDRIYVENMAQTSEVWHVRTVTNGLNTLQLGEYGESDAVTYVYSGALGFAQSYAGTSQAHVPWGDGFDLHSEDWYFGTNSMATSTLSLTKASSSTQYIHTALVQDLSVYEGTLGFNNLQVQGNMNLMGGSTLSLGVTGKIGSQEWKDSGTHNVNYEKRATSSSVRLESGKTLTVITQKETVVNGKEVPLTATVKGNLTLAADTALTFRVNGVLPYSVQDNLTTGSQEGNIVPLLTVTGNLTLPASSLSVTLTGLDFSTTTYANQKYYLARADEILVGSGNETTFVPKTISLGYGYFGTLYAVGDKGSSLKDDKDKASSYDYLVMTVNGDPRRTWHGIMNEEVASSSEYDYIDKRNYTWSSGTAGDTDYRWKENLSFDNGHVVLFGNLYQPKEWTSTSNQSGGNRMDSEQTVQVTSSVKHVGTLVQETDENNSKFFNIDGYTVEDRTGAAGFQAVKVLGEVAPFSLIINSDYWQDDKTASTEDATHYYFYTTSDKDGVAQGAIRDASVEELTRHGFDANWKTMLHKTGKGTVVMELDNRYTGGSVLQGGRMVMKHVNALGYVYNGGTGGENTSLFTGHDCTITLMNNAALQGDFDDEDFPGNRVESGNVSLGKAMKTTTIHNKVVVNVYADPGNPGYSTLVDGRLINSHDKKLILTKLEGESDTVLELAGVGLGSGNKFRYGVFKVLDPSRFYGTVTMSGHVWGLAETGAGGMVQLDIMSTAKSDEEADWTNASVDLSVLDGTDRTVVALDVMSDGEICKLNSITGTVRSGGSSSVLNMSKHNAATLQLTGTRDGDYDGVLGYGDFQVAVNYGGYAEAEQGTTQHHYGAIGHGSLNVVKQGEGSTQAVRRAWLNSLKVEGGAFVAKEALVAHDITAGGGKRVRVGNADPSSLYALTIGKGGTLAMNTTFAESGRKQDAWANITGGTTQGDTTTWVAWVLLEDGATLSAREDWYTSKQVDIATAANVTINTHNFAIDPYINEKNDVFGKYGHSHIIQLLGKVTGKNVTLNVVNQLTDPNNGDAIRNNVESEYMGYVAIMDHNDFTESNKVNVGAMTALQVLGSNGGVEADVDISVVGKNATLQVVDKQVQYVDQLVLGANALNVEDNDPLHRENNGQFILGGKEVTTLVPNSNDYLTKPDKAGERVVISGRHDDGVNAATGQKYNAEQAAISHVHVDLSGSSVKIGGADGHHAVASNVHMDVVDNSTRHTVYHTDFKHSLIHLQEDCSIDLSDMVMVDVESAVMGVNVLENARTVSPLVGPRAASGTNPTRITKEVKTSGDTTVQLTFADVSANDVHEVGNSTILVLQTEQLLGVDVTGSGLTIQLCEDMQALGEFYKVDFIALQIGGGSGQFLFEQDNTNFANLIDSEFVLQDMEGNNMTGYWVTSQEVATASGVANVSMHMLYFTVPEPATATLSLAALVALMGRRRRKN